MLTKQRKGQTEDPDTEKHPVPLKLCHKMIEWNKGFRLGVHIVDIMVGSVIYFYYKMEQSLKSLINTHVLDIDKKHPHYIYLNYSIYKEHQLAEMKNSQAHDKVTGEKWKNDDFYVLNVDHVGLSKPNTQQSLLYQRLLMIIKDVLVAFAKENASKRAQDDDDDCEPHDMH
ncbi:hypothetical protein Bhyg_08810 [Pseudolycoriella hygida]|uniref:Uncharacterized protein n=1 Tax=Pseudolycoriella hygida TaxID=35572 RepID=A0A9Q0S5B2_9DIPT|nr:hypothetical protein Bhyg_08810 [Pseudolycoriella hygida]